MPQAPPRPAPPHDYSREAFLLERVITDITFTADGAGTREQTFTVKLQSEAGVRQFGILSFGYVSGSESFEPLYVRVRKPDGTVVETPLTAVQDMPSEITRSAPMYSDLREKQIPVKSLGAGDTLEYKVRFISKKAEIPGQFWWNYDFVRGAVMKGETVAVHFPLIKYVNVLSPSSPPDIHDENGVRTYTWRHSQLQTTEELQNAKSAKPIPSPDIEITTFKTWNEVGRWYRELQKAQVVVTPAVRAKAEELTKGFAADSEKQQALYSYVATKFRYISLSFGTGRYRPHSADEVLSNQYGDCKDKHTLLAALFKASGYEAWPALIGAGLNFDPGAPSPAQFNHLITVLPSKDGYVWLDSTSEVAPFGMLQAIVRDSDALVLPDRAEPSLVKTPPNTPFSSHTDYAFKGALSEEGVLSGQFDITTRGDDEFNLRSAFHQLPQAQWTAAIQNVSYASNYAGTVSNLQVTNPDDTRQALHFSYDYLRKDYSDWQNRRIAVALPPVVFAYTEESERPAIPIELGPVGETKSRASVQLPKGYSITLPPDSRVESKYAAYSSTYSASDGILTAERTFAIRAARIPADSWQDYLKFEKEVFTDENRMCVLSKGAFAVSRDNPLSQDLLKQAFTALSANDLPKARDLFEQVEKVNPTQLGLWYGFALLHSAQNNQTQGLADLKKEIRNHPENTGIYKSLAQLQFQLGMIDDGVITYRDFLKTVPDNIQSAVEISDIFRGSKRHQEAIAVIDEFLAKTPNDVRLLAAKGGTMLYSGKKEEGAAILRGLADRTLDLDTLNTVAYQLACTDTDLPLAKQYSQKAVILLEQAMSNVTLESLTVEDLGNVSRLGAFWDTLGWVYWHMNDADKARDYLYAAWVLIESGAIAEHLGQMYEKLGDRGQAVRYFHLALAADPRMSLSRERLGKLGAETSGDRNPQPAIEELGFLRTIPLPRLDKHEGSAEFFVLMKNGAIEDSQFISGADSLKTAAALLKQAYPLAFPGAGQEKVVRRGVLSCSPSTKPACSFVLYLPGVTTK